MRGRRLPDPVIVPNPLGHIIEGTVERDPLTGISHITVLENGKAKIVSIQDLLASYEGQEVRFTLASFENLSKLAGIVETSGQSVHGVMPEDLPQVPFNIVRRER